MARQPITICGKSFPTKKALEEEAKRIRNGQPLGVALSEEDRAFILEVFQTLYPDWSTRVGLGLEVRRIFVNFVEGARCFHMKLSNGGFVEPSLRVAFNPSLAKSKPTAMSAFRYEAWIDCCAPYRDDYFRSHANAEGLAPCEISGTLMRALREECEVDHIPPNTFKVILEDFLRIENLRVEDVETRELPNGRIVVLKEPLGTRWRTYHRSRAKLRVLARSTHVALTKEQIDWTALALRPV